MWPKITSILLFSGQFYFLSFTHTPVQTLEIIFHRTKGQFNRKHEETEILLPPPPLNLTIRKGSRYVALDRVKAKTMVNDQLAISLQSWLEYTYIPDEHYYSTIATVKSYKLKVNNSLHVHAL